VWKPAGETPLSALAQAVLAEEAGFPKGSINVITSLTTVAEVGEELCKNPKVHKLSFTGSTRVGKLLMQQSASTLKKLSLELGGNSPFIVFDDAKMSTALYVSSQSTPQQDSSRARADFGRRFRFQRRSDPRKIS